MRLFIAINFDMQTIARLELIQKNIKDNAFRGNFSRRQNLHITLAFLGETPASKLQEIKRVMDEAACKPFPICLKGASSFKRDGGDVIYIGISKNAPLSELQKRLCQKLGDTGFSIDGREYKPHLTIAREAVLKKPLSEIAAFEPIGYSVGAISLMKSERVNGVLTYTEIYKKELGTDKTQT